MPKPLLLAFLLTLTAAALTLPPIDSAAAQEPTVHESTLTVTNGKYGGVEPGPTFTLNRGDILAILLVNEDSQPHNIVIPDFGVQSATLQPGQNQTLAFVADKTGTFAYFCSVPGHSHSGTIVVKGVLGTIQFDKSKYDPGDFARVVVVDPDADATPDDLDTVSVAVRSTTDPSGITLQLLETGVGTGTFEGWLTLTSSPASASELKVSSGDTVKAEYTDTTTPTGESATLEATATIGEPRTIILTLTADRASYQPGDTILLRGVLKDSNNNPLADATVNLKIQPPTGNPATLTATTDSAGAYTATHTLPGGSPAGSYVATATYFTNTVQTTFTVTAPQTPTPTPSPGGGGGGGGAPPPTPPAALLPTEIAAAGAVDLQGNPKSSFRPGETVFFPATVKNNEREAARMLVAVQVYAPDGTVMPPVFISVVLDPGGSFPFRPSLLLPPDAQAGEWSFEVVVFSDFPAKAGVPLTEPALRTFTVAP